MKPSPAQLPKSLEYLIEAAVGKPNNYSLNFWGQAAMGAFYSLGLLPWHIVGLLLGLAFPGIWVFCSYRLIRKIAGEGVTYPFPKWLRKDPGNLIFIIIDLIFLGTIWFFILTGFLDRTWIKILFTVIFPLLTLSVLRGLLVFWEVRPGMEENQNKDQNKDQKT